MNNPVLLAEEGVQVVNELPMDAIWYGVIAFALLMLMLLATMSLRSVSLRHEEPSTAIAQRTAQRSYGHKAGK